MSIELWLSKTITSDSMLFKNDVETWCNKYKKHALFYISFYPLYDSGNSASGIEEAVSNEMTSICIKSASEIPLFKLLVILDKTLAFTPSKLVKQMEIVLSLINCYRRLADKFNSIEEHSKITENSILIHTYPTTMNLEQHHIKIFSELKLDVLEDYQYNLNCSNHAIKQLKSIYNESSQEKHDNTLVEHKQYKLDPYLPEPIVFSNVIINEIVKYFTGGVSNIPVKIKSFTDYSKIIESKLISVVPELCEYVLMKYRHKIHHLSSRQYKQPPFKTILNGIEYIYDTNKAVYIDQLSFKAIDTLISIINGESYVKIFDTLATYNYISFATERINTELYRRIHEYFESHQHIKESLISQFDITTLINISGEKL